MENKKNRVIETAKEVFLKYGYVKTTMNDLAKAAGISRPALYLIYAGKEEIYNDVILYLSRELSEKVKRESEFLEEPMEKLKKVFHVWSLEMFELLHASEEARELYQSSFPFAREAMKKSTMMFEEDITNALRQFPPEELTDNLKVKEIAHIFSTAVPGLKQNSENTDELRHKIDLLLKMGLRSK